MSSPNQEMIKEFAAVAQIYCQQIEAFRNGSTEKMLEQMRDLLPKIHAGVSALGAGEPEAVPKWEHADFDQRFELFSQIRESLGERDGYTVDFHADAAEQTVTGSLADDLTDIYFDLRTGLDLLQQSEDGRDKALHSWLETFRLHWGQHLFDAIFALKAQ